MTLKTAGSNIDPKWYLLIFYILGVISICLFASCSPVKRVLLNDKYYKQVTDKFILDGGCVNDTVFASDTTVLFDTLYSLDYKTDTVTIDNIKSIVKTEYKTVTKTVTIRDTAVVTDQTQINLLKQQLAEKNGIIAAKDTVIAGLEKEVEQEAKRANKWALRFWLLILLALIVIFRKPIWRLLSPIKISNMKRFLPILFLLASCAKIDVKTKAPKTEDLIIEPDTYEPPGGFNKTGSRLLDLKEQVKKDDEAYRRGGNGGKGPDTDKDGIINKYDNCPADYNPLQEDADKDGIGDICDGFTDADFDGIEDGIDNCPVYNPQQTDCDRDGKGDACDTDICTPNPETVYEHVVFLDFDGDYVTSSFWTPYTAGQPFYVRSSGLTDIEIAKVVERVRYDYRMFKVTITTDSTVFARAAIYKRQKVVITQDNEWYGVAGGVAYIGSMFTFSNITPAFVFSKLLSYNWFYIAGASSHEAGHTMFLRHQIDIDLSTCTLKGSYRPGFTMGNPYYTVNTSQIYDWTIGPSNVKDTTALCTWKVQDDKAVIGQRVPYQ